MRKIIETDRLILREFADVDARDLLSLNSDPTVIRYTGDEPFGDFQAALAFVQAYDHYRRHGFGRWAVIMRHSGEFAGFCGLRHDGRTGRVDLGFRYHRRFWSRGIATEAGRAALRVGFAGYKLPIIFGRAMRENLPSVSVLQKLGMSFREVSEEDGSVWLVYAIRANEFVPPRPPAQADTGDDEPDRERSAAGDDAPAGEADAPGDDESDEAPDATR